MDDSSPRPRPWVRWFPIVGLGLFSLLPLYVASVGPACWFEENGWLSESAYETAYAPLAALAYAAPPLYSALDEYAIWWQGLPRWEVAGSSTDASGG